MHNFFNNLICTHIESCAGSAVGVQSQRRGMSSHFQGTSVISAKMSIWDLLDDLKYLKETVFFFYKRIAMLWEIVTCNVVLIIYLWLCSTMAEWCRWGRRWGGRTGLFWFPSRSGRSEWIPAWSTMDCRPRRPVL